MLLEKINELKSEMNDISVDFAEECYNRNDYICDTISEYADSQVDIYNSDLWQWASENYTYIEEAMDEFGTPKKFDMMKAIQQGQWYYNEQLLYEDLENIIKLSALLLLDLEKEEPTEETIGNILEEVEGLDHNDTFDAIYDIILKVLEKNE